MKKPYVLVTHANRCIAIRLMENRQRQREFLIFPEDAHVSLYAQGAKVMARLGAMIFGVSVEIVESKSYLNYKNKENYI